MDYAAGVDLRARCEADRADQYRLVFNGEPGYQPDRGAVRVYDVIGDGTGALVEAWALPRGEAGQDEGERLRLAHAAGQSVHLSVSAFARVRALLGQEGIFAGEVRAQESSYFWLVTGCHEGRFFMALSSFPADAFSEIALRNARLSFGPVFHRRHGGGDPVSARHRVARVRLTETLANPGFDKAVSETIPDDGRMA
ncbi:MAG: hypothetical protein P4M00_19310 [Azospirillaceae bacterium]|nr:hypothetical protein [Azospirillaceae bacterium]